jgi:hypothetical protein
MGRVLTRCDALRQGLEHLDESRTAEEVEARVQKLDNEIAQLRLEVVWVRAELSGLRVSVQAKKICGMMARLPEVLARPGQDARMRAANDRTFEEDVVLESKI